MGLWPFEKLKLYSPMSPTEAMQRLSGCCFQGRRNWLSFTPPQGDFEGKLDGTRFQISRVINYRNSFLPIVQGEIRPQGKGSLIEATLSLQPAVVIFILIWMGAVSMGSVAGLAALLNGEKAGLIPLGMWVFGAALTIIGFKAESGPTRARLKELWQASEES